MLDGYDSLLESAQWHAASSIFESRLGLVVSSSTDHSTNAQMHVAYADVRNGEKIWSTHGGVSIPINLDDPFPMVMTGQQQLLSAL